jgi:RNA polymerase sigma-70 factor (ECF subfamily)
MATPLRLPEPGSKWIERIRAGDESAFEALFRALAPGLCAIGARYVDSRSVAEEIVQDLFLDLWRRRDQLTIEDGLTGYLVTAMRHRALNHLRRERRIVGWTPGVTENAAAESASESELLDALELQDAIAALPARCRLIFTLSRHQDMTYREIAASLGLSVKTVETQMGRALKSLRERLKHLIS